MMPIPAAKLSSWCRMDKRVVEIVLERAGFYCEACGSSGSDFALHHRQLRSQGGKDEPCNLIAIHHACHNLGTNSIHLKPAKAISLGQIVPSWSEPSEHPLQLPDGRKVLLNNEGDYIEIEGEDGEDTNNW